MKCLYGGDCIGSCGLGLDLRVVDFQLLGIGLRPSSHLAVRFELSVAESLLGANRIDRSALDLKVYLHVDVDRSGMLKGALAAKQI